MVGAAAAFWGESRRLYYYVSWACNQNLEVCLNPRELLMIAGLDSGFSI